MSFKIIEAHVEHAEIIRKIAFDSYWPTYAHIISAKQINYMLSVNYSLEKITGHLISGSQKYLLYQDIYGEFVAFAAYSSGDESLEAFKLEKLYCLAKSQGKGVGKRLIEEVIQIARLDGFGMLGLNVNRHNPAVSFYGKMGFRIILEENNPIGPYMMNDYVMCKEF